MSTLAHLVIAYVLVAGAAIFFIVCLCVVSKDSDEQAEEELRRERTRFPLAPDPEKARIERGNGGWRSR